MKDIYNQNKNHSHQTYRPHLSDMFSSDVPHSILSSLTDTLQALNEALDVTKVRNNTQSAKKKIQDFYNGDFKIDYSASFAKIRARLRTLFAMDKIGASDYGVYEVPAGFMTLRLSGHNANGNNFQTEINISVYVNFKEYNVPKSSSKFTEYKIDKEIFSANAERIIRLIIDGFNNALNGKEFDIPQEFAERKDYPLDNNKTSINTENTNKTENSNYNMTTNNKKRLYESVMKDISKTVKQHVLETSFITLS